jgi:D-alanyl-D-alanine carboxypeptidase
MNYKNRMIKYRFRSRISALVSFALIFMVGCQSPLTREEGLQKIQSEWDSRIKDHPELANSQMYIADPDLKVREIYSPANGKREPFHTASVGKLFTTVLIARLIEDGKLDWQTPVAEILNKETLRDLFVVSGKDYSSEVTIAQLLGHTSGIADYFGDKPANAQSVSELILKEPDHTWTPNELLEYNRVHLKALFAPGNGFHYSDSGFVLLGLVIEKKYAKPFHQVIEQQIFRPLGMQSTYMPGRSKPIGNSPALMGVTYLHGKRVDSFNSVTADWAGGGVVSTLEDLMAFDQALFSGKLIKPATIDKLSQFNNKFDTGMHYGLGMMEYRFEEFFPLLSGYPRWKGHLGILSTHLIYDPKRNIYFILNMGSDEALETGFRLLIDISGILMRMHSKP